jgi:hypothetical protein
LNNKIKTKIMKNMNMLLLILGATLLSTSCLREVFCEDGKGQFFTETFAISDFTGVDLEEAATVNIKQGPVQEVVVTAQENILDKLKTEVNGGIWEIDLGRECFNDLELTIDITVPNLDELHVSGSGEMIVEDFIDQGNLDISVTGSGTLQLGVFEGTTDLDAKISGSGEIFASEAFPDLDKLNIELTGSGNFDGFRLVTTDLDARISGSGNLFVTVEEHVDIRITGSGDLHYKGNPLIDANITGSGKIINEN